MTLKVKSKAKASRQFPKIDYKELAAEQLRQMTVKERGMSFKTASPQNSVNPHGPGGLFSYPGLSSNLFSTLLIPNTGVQAELPVMTSMEANPLFGLVTGVTSSTGSEADGPCDDPPYAGLMKLCTHTFVYGRFSRRTRIIDITSTGMVTNRGEFTDMRLFGNYDLPGAPTPTKLAPQLVAAKKALFELGVAMSRDAARDLYTGLPSNNTANGGRTYPYGLDFLINTGYQDAVTKQLCPGADSIVVDFGSLDVASNGSTIVRILTNVLRRLKHIAKQTGLSPVFWKFAMPAALFYELSAVWPCAYETYLCTAMGDASRERFVTDRRYLNDMTTSMRGDMYNETGQFLLIDGQQVPVKLDDTITETVLAGESFKASIYIIPYTVLGGMPVTYIEAKNYDAPGAAMENARFFNKATGAGQSGSFFTSDGGRFLWHNKPENNYCLETSALVEWRLLLLTPQLAARITNVKYTPLKHERNWDPNSSFYADGGRTDFVGFGPSFNPPHD